MHEKPIAPVRESLPSAFVSISNVAGADAFDVLAEVTVECVNMPNN